jgi:phosphoribosylaminoimidazole-succinocarboxamide synthase
MTRKNKVQVFTPELVFEGNNKKFYTSEEENCLIMKFKDTITLRDGTVFKMKGHGELRNKISTILFEYLHNFNILTHYIKPVDESSMLVRKLNMIPIKVVVRNIAAGNFAIGSGLKKAESLISQLLNFITRTTHRIIRLLMNTMYMLCTSPLRRKLR